MQISKILIPSAIALLMGSALIGCGPKGEETTNGASGSSGGSSEKVAGELNIEGSGTVFPIAAALTELFNGENPDVKVTVGKKGTGAGMEVFAKGESDVATASRPIKDKEIKALEDAGIEFIEMPIAYDGLCIVVSKENTWLKSINIEQLNKMWNADSQVKKWNEIDPSWPDAPLNLYGPTDAHGTFEYFNETVNGDGANTRQDYSQQAEYDPLIAGVAGDVNALGYVGYAYVEQNLDKVRVVAVDGGAGPVEPNGETILNGSYAPFSRPLMLYISKGKMESNPALKAFVTFALGPNAPEAIRGSGYIPMPQETVDIVKAWVEGGNTGSKLSGAKGATLNDLFGAH